MSHAASEFYKFPTYTYESYVETFGTPPPPYDPKSPAKSWADPSATPEGMGVRSYYYISSDQSKSPVILAMSLPEYVACAYNIPTQEWEVTPGKNPNTWPIPVTEEFAEDVFANKYTMRWQMGILVIDDVLPPEETIVPWTLADRQKLDAIYNSQVGTVANSKMAVQGALRTGRSFQPLPMIPID